MTFNLEEFAMIKTKRIFSAIICFLIIVSTLCAMTIPAFAASSSDRYTENVTTGKYVTIKNVGSGKLLNVYGNQNRNNANVTVYQADGTTGQLFQFVKKGNAYVIVPRCATSRAVNVYGNSAKNNSNVCLWSKTGHNTQSWIIDYNPSFSGFVIRSANNQNYVLTATGSKNSSNVCLKKYNPKDKYQVWTSSALKVSNVSASNQNSSRGTNTAKAVNLSSKCNIVKTYKIGNTKYYYATLKTGYNGVKKGSMVFLNSNYTAVTNSAVLEKLMFTYAVDILSSKTNGFESLRNNYANVKVLNDVCQKILDAQLTQKFIGSASGSVVSTMVSANPMGLISSGKYLTKESYMTLMTAIYLDGITNTALDESNKVKNYCKDGISSFEEAEKVETSLVNARAAFLIAGTDCMQGLASGYTSKRAATLNSLKTYLSAMCNTLMDTYGGKIVKIIEKCSKGKDILSELNNIYGYGSCYKTAQKTFSNMFDGAVNGAISEVSKTQAKLAK